MGRQRIPDDNAITTLASTFTAGMSTSFAVASGKGPLFCDADPSVDHPVRLTLIKQSAYSATTGLLTDATLQATYRATTRTGDVFSGLTFESGDSALSFGVGDVVAGLWDAAAARALDADLATAEAALAAFASPLLADEAALPVPGVAYRGQIRVVQGTTGVPDSVRVCIKLDDDSYAWRPILL